MDFQQIGQGGNLIAAAKLMVLSALIAVTMLLAKYVKNWNNGDAALNSMFLHLLTRGSVRQVRVNV